MKSLVVFSSQTNNTKKLAEAAATELDAEMVPVAEVGDISDYDHIAVGFWLKAGGDKKRKALLSGTASAPAVLFLRNSPRGEASKGGYPANTRRTFSSSSTLSSGFTQ